MQEELIKLFGESFILNLSDNKLELTEQEKNNSERCIIEFKNFDLLFRINHKEISNNEKGNTVFLKSKLRNPYTKAKFLTKICDAILIGVKNDITHLYIVEYKLTIGSRTYNKEIHPQWISSCISVMWRLGLIQNMENIQINWIIVGNFCDRDRQNVETWLDDERIYGRLLRNSKATTKFDTELRLYNLKLSDLYANHNVKVFHIQPNTEFDLLKQ